MRTLLDTRNGAITLSPETGADELFCASLLAVLLLGGKTTVAPCGKQPMEYPSKPQGIIPIEGQQGLELHELLQPYLDCLE